MKEDFFRQPERGAEYSRRRITSETNFSSFIPGDSCRTSTCEQRGSGHSGRVGSRRDLFFFLGVRHCSISIILPSFVSPRMVSFASVNGFYSMKYTGAPCPVARTSCLFLVSRNFADTRDVYRGDVCIGNEACHDRHWSATRTKIDIHLQIVITIVVFRWKITTSTVFPLYMSSRPRR